MFESKDEVRALYAAYKALEEKKAVFRNHGVFTTLETESSGVEGFWLFDVAEDPLFVPKFVIQALAPFMARKPRSVQTEEVPKPPETPEAKTASPINWTSPDIQRRLNDVVSEAQAADTRYIRVISKSKSGKQVSLARIAQGTNADTVVKIIMNARRKTKERTVMAEVLKTNLKRTMARSFPLELINA